MTSILTPPASSDALSQNASPLPQPRRNPLKPGGPKESELIRYLDYSINQIQKRVDNRVTNRKTKPQIGEVEGYRAFWQVAKDIDGLIDVVWVSGSPNLQTPYLLNLAMLIADFLPLFPTSERSTQSIFALLSKLDYAFSSMIMGKDAATGEPLPGLESGRKISTTDKVRLKGIVDRTRLTVVRVTNGESIVGNDEDVGEPMDTDIETETETETEGDILAGGHKGTVKFEGFDEDDEDEEWEERNVASVYEKTIGKLGDVLGGPPIGIITDDWSSQGMNDLKCSQGFVEPDEEMDL